jgi:AraC-like DNA-binding protein
VQELDLRTRDFGDWVSSFLDIPVADIYEKAETKANAEDVRSALGMLGNTAALEHSSAARQLHCSGGELQGMLLQLLSADPPPAPLSRRSQNLLNQLQVHAALSPEAAAARLHISRATYYRHLREALDQAVQFLNQRRLL